MARAKKRDSVYMGGKFETELSIAFANLSKNQHVSIHEGLRRLMTQAVIDGRIPGINNVDLAMREREKWGESTVPVFDGEETPRKQKHDPQASAPHAGSSDI